LGNPITLEQQNPALPEVDFHPTVGNFCLGHKPFRPAGVWTVSHWPGGSGFDQGLVDIQGLFGPGLDIRGGS
jgi:hypothetical protein